jgi:hypothetical protein
LDFVFEFGHARAKDVLLPHGFHGDGRRRQHRTDVDYAAEWDGTLYTVEVALASLSIVAQLVGGRGAGGVGVHGAKTRGRGIKARGVGVGHGTMHKASAVSAIVAGAVFLAAQFLSFVPYWLNEDTGDTHVGPWFKYENNQTVGLADFGGSAKEWQLTTASSILLMLISSIFYIAASAVYSRRTGDHSYQKYTKRTCPPTVPTALLILSGVHLIALFITVLSVASARSALQETDGSQTVTTDYSFGVVYYLYIVFALGSVIVQVVSAIFLMRGERGERGKYDLVSDTSGSGEMFQQPREREPGFNLWSKFKTRTNSAGFVAQPVGTRLYFN